MTDYDLICCIISFERFEKVDRLLTALTTQKTKHKFKILLIDDGSEDERYSTLSEKYPDIFYFRNPTNFGKMGYWKNFNFLWSKIKAEYTTLGVAHIDDDHIICKSFIDRLMERFYVEKAKDVNNCVFQFHISGRRKEERITEKSKYYKNNFIWVDGGCLISIDFLQKIDFQLDQIAERVNLSVGSPSFVYPRIKELLIEHDLKCYVFRKSLIKHDGNEDSKMHPILRKVNKIHSKNFIDD